MTGWHFRVGYLSGDTYKGSKEDAWQSLRMAALGVVTDDIARGLPGIPTTEMRQAVEFLNSAMKIWFEPGESVGQVVITASGGGEWRAWRERVCRAFTRQLIQDMHALDIDVCVEVS